MTAGNLSYFSFLLAKEAVFLMPFGIDCIQAYLTEISVVDSLQNKLLFQIGNIAQQDKLFKENKLENYEESGAQC